jgi:hypothetical protein
MPEKFIIYAKLLSVKITSYIIFLKNLNDIK